MARTMSSVRTSLCVESLSEPKQARRPERLDGLEHDRHAVRDVLHRSEYPASTPVSTPSGHRIDYPREYPREYPCA